MSPFLGVREKFLLNYQFLQCSVKIPTYTQQYISNVDFKGSRICMYIIILLKNIEKCVLLLKRMFLLELEIVAQVKSINKTGRSDKNYSIPVPFFRFAN